MALGNFDGVHKGHQQLINKAVRAAQRHGIKSAVFTFSNHPKSMLPGNKEVKNIIYQEEKIALIEKLGVDYLFNIKFTKEIQTMDPVDFIRKLLYGKLMAAETFCGFNYRFGYKAAGNIKLLREEGKRLGIRAVSYTHLDVYKRQEFIQAIDDLERERHISKDVLIEAIESALVSAYKKNYGTAPVSYTHLSAMGIWLQTSRR